MAIVDCYRYGRFEYASAGDIPEDGYIELPTAATNIILYLDGAGHVARFSVDTESLRMWIDEKRALRPNLNEFHDDDKLKASPNDDRLPEVLLMNQELFAERFPNTGWSYDPEMVERNVQRNDRGGGYSIWHIPFSGDTYLSAGYW